MTNHRVRTVGPAPTDSTTSAAQEAGHAPQRAAADGPGVVASDRRRHRRATLPLIGIAGFALTAAGLTGVGDAPHPTQSDASIAAHFDHVRTAVLASAPLGQLGAVAIGGFVLALARRLHRVGAAGFGLTTVGGLIAASYLLLLHVVYATLSYEVATSSAPATKALFVSTILAVPLFGLGIAVALGAAAYGAARSHLLPAWWSVISGTGAIVAALAVVSYADSGFFSPDVQQQVTTNVLLSWLLMTAVTLATRRPDADR